MSTQIMKHDANKLTAEELLLIVKMCKDRIVFLDQFRMDLVREAYKETEKLLEKVRTQIGC